MNKKGFTLVELLAIIVILGILASISTALVGNYVKKSKQDATRVTAQNMINVVLGDLEINDEITNKTYDFLGVDSNLLEKKLKTSAWDNDVVEAKVNYDNGKIEICIRDSKNNGIKGTADQVKEKSKDLQYKDIDCTSIPSSNPKSIVASDMLQNLVGTDGLEKITHEVDNTLQVDERFKIEYRYRGGNSVVKNYVTFNNEVWRIIGVIPTENTNGNVENRVKIIKNESIGNMYCNTTKDTTTNSKNNWVTGTLNTYLNSDYYNTLTSDAKNMIGTTKYYLGGYKERCYITTDVMWQYERKSSGSDYYYKINPIMQNDASKKIAIMYVSDYGYAASKNCTSNLYDYKNSTNCITTNNWLDNSVNTWLLSSYSDDDSGKFLVRSSGCINCDKSVGVPKNSVLPVLTLLPNVKIVSGDGTSSNPYKLSL